MLQIQVGNIFISHRQTHLKVWSFWFLVFFWHNACNEKFIDYHKYMFRSLVWNWTKQKMHKCLFDCICFFYSDQWNAAFANTVEKIVLQKWEMK